jgi:hypothetical protein
VGRPKRTAISQITDYYLPGVTVGVDAVADIPIPTYEGDDASLLEAIFAGDTDINYDVAERALYLGGPMVEQGRDTLDATQL